MYILLLLLIYLAFISLGLPDSLLGAGWPVMQQVFDVPLSYAGLVTMIISCGTICSSLLSDRLTRRFGTRIVTVASVFLTAVALFGFSTADRFWMLCLWAIPYGLGAGAIDAALNNYVALHYSSRHMSWLHCFWGVGTIVSPYIMSYALLHAGWQSGYRMVSYVQLGITLVLVVTLPLWKVNQGQTEQAEENIAVLGVRGALRIPGVPSLLTGFFAYCAAESTVMLWASTYLVQTRQMPKERAAAFASLFFIGITAGRFLSGLVSDRLGDRRLIRIGTCVEVMGILCIALPTRIDGIALVGFVIIGLGCAPVYPSIIHSTPYNFGEENSQGIIGIQMASAYVGSTLMPPVFGLIANHVSIYLMPIYLILFVGLMIYMVERTFRSVQKGS
ncbi:MAG: MFS transporter [Lachnospiraceae bacterium]|nr:MFS transporter [Lachnospiraceae bacterium]